MEGNAVGIKSETACSDLESSEALSSLNSNETWDTSDKSSVNKWVCVTDPKMNEQLLTVEVPSTEEVSVCSASDGVSSDQNDVQYTVVDKDFNDTVNVAPDATEYILIDVSGNATAQSIPVSTSFETEENPQFLVLDPTKSHFRAFKPKKETAQKLLKCIARGNSSMIPRTVPNSAGLKSVFPRNQLLSIINKEKLKLKGVNSSTHMQQVQSREDGEDVHQGSGSEVMQCSDVSRRSLSRLYTTVNSNLKNFGPHKVILSDPLQCTDNNNMSSCTSMIALLCGGKQNRRTGYQCVVCDEHFQERDKFRLHIRHHINSESTGAKYQMNFPGAQQQTLLYKCNSRIPLSAVSRVTENLIITSDTGYDSHALPEVTAEYRSEDEMQCIECYLCEQCGMSFESDPLLKEHVKTKHGWV